MAQVTKLTQLKESFNNRELGPKNNWVYPYLIWVICTRIKKYTAETVYNYNRKAYKKQNCIFAHTL